MTELTIAIAAAALLGGTFLFGAVASAAPAGSSPYLSSSDGIVVARK